MLVITRGYIDWSHFFKVPSDLNWSHWSHLVHSDAKFIPCRRRRTHLKRDIRTCLTKIQPNKSITIGERDIWISLDVFRSIFYVFSYLGKSLYMSGYIWRSLVGEILFIAQSGLRITPKFRSSECSCRQTSPGLGSFKQHFGAWTQFIFGSCDESLFIADQNGPFIPSRDGINKSINRLLRDVSSWRRSTKSSISVELGLQPSLFTSWCTKMGWLKTESMWNPIGRLTW